MILFNHPFKAQSTEEYVLKATDNLQGNTYQTLVKKWFEKHYNFKETYLTHTCTDALEMIALAMDIKKGDEIIMPSFTYVSTANAFVLRGATLVFVDVDHTLNIDLDQVEQAINKNTRAVVAVHYGGISCDMEKLSEMTEKNGIVLIEDAAQAINSQYNNRFLGTYGDFSCLSFHHTKNVTSGGEGGLLVVNSHVYKEKLDFIYEKGTNRLNFLQGLSENYTWQSLGSSYGMDELRAAYLYAQLSEIDQHTKARLEVIKQYVTAFETNDFLLNGNGHLFYLILKKDVDRAQFINCLYEKNVQVVSHYEPLHLSDMGEKYGRTPFSMYNTMTSKQQIRLPVHGNLTQEMVSNIIESVKECRNG